MKSIGIIGVILGVTLLVLAIPQINTSFISVGGSTSSTLATMFALSMVLAALAAVAALIVALTRA